MRTHDQPEAVSPTGSTARATLQLPFDVLRSAQTGYARGTLRWSLASLPARSTFLGTLCAVLARYTNQDLIALDVAIDEGATRKYIELDCPVEAESKLSALIEHAERALGAARSAGKAELASVSVIFTSEEIEVGAGALAREQRPHDISLVVLEGATPALIALYNQELFRPTTIERMVSSLKTALAAVDTHHAAPVHQLPLLSAEDQHAISVTWDSGSHGPVDAPMHVLFERWARETPEAVAARFGDTVLSYGELEARANRLAQHMIATGVTRSSTVAVCTLPSFDVLVSLLAVFKVGAIYVPLDPTHPEALIATILDEARPRLVLTQASLSALTHPARFKQFCLDRDWDQLRELSQEKPQVDVSTSDAAYLLYTSGTTGKPKGVVASHENLGHYLRVAREKYGFSRTDRFCSLARYTFSISMFELLSPLSCGASLRLMIRDDVLAPERLASMLAEVTVLHAGPSLLTSLFRYLKNTGAHGGVFGDMRHASSGGDIVSPSVCEDMKRVFPHAELFVIYGSTEISCMGCTYPILRDVKVTRSFVGKAFPDVTVRVADAHGHPVPIGVVGEICFAGKGVVQGYLHRPELNQEKFVQREGKRFYTMGDLGRLHEDGNVEILGRRDYQVQLRGIRVELPGIENVVREIGLAAQCAVTVKRIDEQDVRLIAFVVAPKETNLSAFRRTLAQHLPDYMLPQGLVVLDALPLTRNGKLDRARLDELPWQQQPETSDRVAPRTPLEQHLAAAFASALGRAEVGIDDDFFELGGHSLLVITVTEQIENKLGRSLSPALMFEHTTVRALAEHMDSQGPVVPKPIPLGKQSGKPPLFLLLGVHVYRELAKLLDHQYSVYGIYAESELDILSSEDQGPSVPALAREYVSIIRRAQPHGPYRVAGMSFGGIVAYEVAQQLISEGEQVSFLGLLDSVLPEVGRRARLNKVLRMLALPRPRKLEFLREKLQVFQRRLRGEQKPVEFSRYHAIPTLAERERLREAAYFRATMHYLRSMRPFAGPALLTVAGERLARHPLETASCGFAPWIPALEVHVLDADHLTLLELPAVHELARLFLRGLASAERRSIPPQPTASQATS